MQKFFEIVGKIVLVLPIIIDAIRAVYNAIKAKTQD